VRTGKPARTSRLVSEVKGCPAACASMTEALHSQSSASKESASRRALLSARPTSRTGTSCQSQTPHSGPGKCRAWPGRTKQGGVIKQVNHRLLAHIFQYTDASLCCSPRPQNPQSGPQMPRAGTPRLQNDIRHHRQRHMAYSPHRSAPIRRTRWTDKKQLHARSL
jgi:hypothetical protein